MQCLETEINIEDLEPNIIFMDNLRAKQFITSFV